MKRDELRDFFRWPLPPKTEFPSPPVHLTNSCVLFFHYGSIYLYMTAVRSASFLLITRKKKKTKNINTSSLSSYCLENRLYNYNSTRFRYMTKKKRIKEKETKNKKRKREKKWNTRCCFLSPFHKTHACWTKRSSLVHIDIFVLISALKLRWPQP